ncbi:Putative diheme cytochrome c-553 [Thioalkalivibrio nitratireducens DSM 14787]|uniref:Diheme cytochrome c-553 n=1 Tax=Thioalkalivibrio nitratireducens (strain DSM 14787 / UNIQEM 213 / ALEN2) TaxID=1255043 RepID=L0DQR0_THIND|nr:Putative diheme cytochrome c-553 [Thioalkalivibrio nitratireducens DSM 14787]
MLLAPALFLSSPGAAVGGERDAKVRQGEYLLRAGGCVSCHTEKRDDAPFLAGGRAIESPFGTFYGPNITPDPETGIGRWAEDDFVRALRNGRNPSGSHYYPAFPYTSYTRLRREDIGALWAYLQTVEPVRRENRPHDLVWYARFRPSLAGWKFLHFRTEEFEPRADETDEWNRGAYLSQALAHCAECHTPRTRTGGLDPRRLYAGARLADGDVAPNITPDRETGIGRWRASHLLRYLDLGMDPDGDFAGGAMGDVIGEGTSHLTDADRRALVIYLQSLEPIRHQVPPAD